MWREQLSSAKIFFDHKPAGDETPASVGVDYEEYWLESNGGSFQAWFVRAEPADGSPAPAMLIFQGGNDTISELPHLQKYLYDHDLSSMVFDYPGNGKSKGTIDYESMNAAGRAAFEKFVDLSGEKSRKYLWGFSLGTGRLMNLLVQVDKEVDGVFFSGPFTSIRDIPPKPIGSLLFPDYWNNLEAIREVKTPIVIVHSRDDELAPFEHGEKLAQANPHARLEPVKGLKHNDCWKPIHEAYWEPVFANIENN